MTTYLLFCTADVSPETITKLLERPKINCFVLAKDPSQTIFDNWRTNPPVQAFQNGFSGWDVAQIQHYLANDLPESALDPKTNITREQFAILDKTSKEDETVTIYQLLEKSITEEPSSDVEEIDEDDGDEEEVWWHWKVRFWDVDELIGSLETMDALPVFCSEKFVGRGGIFDVEGAREAFVGGDESR